MSRNRIQAFARGSLPFLAVFAVACGEGFPGPTAPDPVEPPAPPPPVAAQIVPCEGGRANGYPCDRIDLVGHLFLPDLSPGRTPTGSANDWAVNDIWGWTDPQTGVEYALVGRHDGLAIVDLSTPTEPRPIAFLPSAISQSIWRDMKVHADHVYVVSESTGHGVQVLDLTRLRGLTEFTELSADARYQEVSAVHNIAINEETGFAYAVGNNSGGETCGGGLHMIDLSNPKNPSFAGCHAEEGTGQSRKIGYTHDVQCVVYRGPDGQHQGREVCVGSNADAVVVSDVTDKANPTTLSVARYADYGYVHQGWLSEDHRYFYQNDELDERWGRVSRTRMLVWDLTDLDDPVLVKEHLGPSEAIDHNLYVHDGLIYHSNYTFGVRILDISDPTNPVERGYFDTVPGRDDQSFDGSWSTYPWFESGIFVATSWDEGLFVLRLQP